MQVFCRFFLLMILALKFFKLNSQVTYYQDVFHGGVSFAGFSTGTAYTGNYNGNFETYFHPGSIIKKVFLLYNAYNEPTFDLTINLDGVDISLERRKFHGAPFKSTQFSSDQNFRVLVEDITEEYNNVQYHQIIIPSQPLTNCNCFYGNFSIVVLYENPLLNPINFSLYLNNFDLDISPTIYNATINPRSALSQIGFSLNTDIINEPINSDGSKIFVNNNLLGIIGGSDGVDQNSLFGVRGHFYYQNSQLFGLDDDSPDFLMNNSDALADISPYLNLGLQFTWSLEWQIASVHQNVYSSFQLAYSTPCQPQNVTVSNDTVVCPNVPLILHATGGTPNSHSTSGYEWLPQENLSCYDCADPIFTGDSSQLYTVRIWGSDSCSVVRPVMVRVRQKPNFSDLNLIASECGGATGTITAFSNSGVSYSLDSLSWQASPNGAYSFQNLSAGNYTIFVTDTSGCIGDSSVFLDETLTVNAAFSASPSSGAVPLEVSITNQSSSYSNLEWFINGVSQGNSLTDYTINQSSTAEITLIAWQNDPSCADTAQVSILAFDSLIISIPNVITANGDGVNDEFSVQSNLPISIEYTITNRWGNVLQSGALQTQSGSLPLWNPATDISEGTYFYQLKFSSSDGNIDQQLETWGRLKQGNIELVR